MPNHGKKTIGASGGEVLAQPQLVDEEKVSLCDITCLLSGEYLEEHSDNTLYDDSIAISGEEDSTVGLWVPRNPDTTLATFDDIIGDFLLYGYGSKLIAHLDDERIAIHPVVQKGEFVYDLVLYFVDCFHSHILVYYFVWAAS